MRGRIYWTLAREGIRKNKQLYLPYAMTLTVMVLMYYILAFMRSNEQIAHIRVGDTIQQLMGFGTGVVAIFSVLFLFYTHTFLMRRRKKEFGLYHVLGMEKRHLYRILAWESFMLSVATLAIGLVLGIGISKLVELGLINILHEAVDYQVSVEKDAVVKTIIVYCGIAVLLFLNSWRQLHFSRTIGLLKSDNVGEAAPKGNRLLGCLGLICLIIAYVIAIRIEHPIEAFEFFFIAVILVIVGTYLLMISGSVVVCRYLQKQPRYYQSPANFVSISSLVFRMKRNGAGLASICILAMMVLVTMTMTISIFAGTKKVNELSFPYDMVTQYFYDDAKTMQEDEKNPLQEEVDQVLAQRQMAPTKKLAFSFLTVQTAIYNDIMIINKHEFDQYGAKTKDMRFVNFISLADYNRLSGESRRLKQGHILVLRGQKKAVPSLQRLKLGKDGETYQIDEIIDNPRLGDKQLPLSHLANDVMPTFYVVTAQLPEIGQALDEAGKKDGGIQPMGSWLYFFDLSADEADKESLANDLPALMKAQYGEVSGRRMVVQEKSADLNLKLQLNGSFLYLGGLLSLVFLLATVLIIYYKQIVEGYEDQNRFAILQKLGMSKQDIRKSVNTQMKTVFFAPLLLAAVHLSFAFPMLYKMLMLFGFGQNSLTFFVMVTLVCYLVFALFYFIVYSITSQTYYRLVQH